MKKRKSISPTRTGRFQVYASVCACVCVCICVRAVLNERKAAASIGRSSSSSSSSCKQAAARWSYDKTLSEIKDFCLGMVHKPRGRRSVELGLCLQAYKIQSTQDVKPAHHQQRLIGMPKY
ncbi:uncharacterized protein LOC110117797 [Ceratitis capitata]|uniref:uncharacterized protein LOC110117797 n=1 Tax=Ceratitis capitata TaxID=7213 RepID=UPI000A0FA423|nr:uncharacterized protein LOC110117797 [Ceratitis capitata]